MTGQLRLADGSSWEIIGSDKDSRTLVASFKNAMQLRPMQEAARSLLLVKNRNGTLPMSAGEESPGFTPTRFDGDHTVVCLLIPGEDEIAFALHLRQISLVIARYAQELGGLLLHGALAEWKGHGVIFAGRAGIGKTTASQRLPAPWKSLCDDLTLIVRDRQGKFLAHPWPTWSRFLPGRPVGSWDVQHAVPLKRIFFLAQAPEDRIETIGHAHAVGLLTRSWSQARFGLPPGIEHAQRTMLRVKGFDTICRIVQTIPSALLHLSLHGTFWQSIEKELE